MTQLGNKKISVVIPCYNEDANVEKLYERLRRVLGSLASDYEIIFVDNKSTDTTRALLRTIAAKDSHVTALFFSRNFGNSQYGYSAGSEYATGDAVVWMEADLQDPPEVIAQFVKKWLEGYDVVYGVRTIYIGSRLMQYYRKLFYRIFRKLSYLDIPVDVGDFSLLDRKVINVINALPERSRFMRGLRAWVGFRSIGVAYKREERAGGVTSNPSFRRNAWWAKKLIYSFSFAPFEFVFRLGVRALVGACIGTVILFYFLWSGTVVLGTALVLFFIFWFGSLTLFSLGLLAEAVGTIFEESKGRPKYIVEEVVSSARR